MFNIISKQNLSPTVRRLDIRCEDLVACVKPGHFVVIAVDAVSPRLPFMVFDVDWRRKCLSIVFEEKCHETRKLGSLKIDDALALVAGPFGMPVPIEKKGAVVCVGEDLGLVSLIMLCRSLKQIGNKLIGVAGFESRKSSLLENQMRLNCSKFYVMYKDGMHERRGNLIEPFKKVIQEENVACVYVDALLATAKDVVAVAAEKNIPVFYNMLDLVLARASFDEMTPVLINGERYFPAVDGVFVEAAKILPGSIIRSSENMKEYVECRRKETESLHHSSVWARLKKFIWG